MTNKELTDFNFVDRHEERNTVKSFLNKTGINVLTVIGKKNVGKNFFIDKVINANKSKTFLVFDFNTFSRRNAYEAILEQLDLYRSGEFILFFKKHYKKIIRTSESLMSQISKEVDKINISDVFMDLINFKTMYVNNTDGVESSVKVLSKYIEEIASIEDTVIVMKNFTKCDEYSLPYLLEVIAITSETKNIRLKYILSMDIDEYKTNSALHNFFSNRIAIIPIVLKAFNDSNLFYEMLMDIFNFTDEDNNSIDHLFNICNGYPGKLRDILNMVYIESHNLFNSKKGSANWNDLILQSALSENHYAIAFENNAIKKLIFMIVLFFRINLTFEMLCFLTVYVSNKMHFFIIDENKIKETISQLIYDDNILEIDTSFVNSRIMISANLNIDAYHSEYENDKITPLLSNALYHYLIENKADIIRIDKDSFLEQLAWHSYKSKCNNWEATNLFVGKYFYSINYFSLSYEIFVRIRDKWHDLYLEDRYVLCKCFYELGKYDYADEIVRQTDLHHGTFEFNMLYVKVKSIRMQKIAAVEKLDEMLKNDAYQKNKYIILDMKQRILSNIKERRKEAKKIFDVLLNDYESGIVFYDDFLISSMEYYRGEIVQRCFSNLEKKYAKDKNTIMLTELQVNRGFDLFWQGNISEAEIIFKNCIPNFESARTHELSYVLNNYANCLMMKGDIENAILTLRRAILFNRSQYAEITVKTNLMVCYALNRDDKLLAIFQELEKYIIENEDSNLDISILLKLTYALGIVQELDLKETGLLYLNCKSYCQKAILMSNSYDKKTLPYIWFKDWMEEVEQDILCRVDNDKYSYFYTYRFEPWLLTITHD